MRDPDDVVDIRTRYGTRRPLCLMDDVARIPGVGRVVAEPSDNLAKSQDVGIEVEPNGGLFHAASGVARDVS